MSENVIGTIFVDGQRCEVLMRTDAQDDGTWHNAVVFRRDGRMTAREEFIAGLPWHVDPEAALDQGMALRQEEMMELFRRATRPRTGLS